MPRGDIDPLFTQYIQFAGGVIRPSHAWPIHNIDVLRHGDVEVGKLLGPGHAKVVHHGVGEQQFLSKRIVFNRRIGANIGGDVLAQQAGVIEITIVGFFLQMDSMVGPSFKHMPEEVVVIEKVLLPVGQVSRPENPVI